MNVAGSRCCTLWFRIDPSQLKNRLTGAHIANLRTLSSLRLFRYRRLGTTSCLTIQGALLIRWPLWRGQRRQVENAGLRQHFKPAHNLLA